MNIEIIRLLNTLYEKPILMVDERELITELIRELLKEQRNDSKIER